MCLENRKKTEYLTFWKKDKEQQQSNPSLGVFEVEPEELKSSSPPFKFTVTLSSMDFARFPLASEISAINTGQNKDKKQNTKEHRGEKQTSSLNPGC